MMRLYVDTNTVGQVAGIYSSESPNIPANAVLLTEAESAMLHGASNLGSFAYINGQLTADPVAIASYVLAAETIAFETAVQAHLDNTVATRGYSGIVSCASYASSTNATFKAEALAAVQWRDAVWSYCYTELAKVKAGTRAVPASAESFITELPALIW